MPVEQRCNTVPLPNHPGADYSGCVLVVRFHFRLKQAEFDTPILWDGK